MWCIYDSEAGYLFECNLYTGQKKNRGPELGLDETVVIQLIKLIVELGSELYVDNFFNSPSLQCYLREKNMRCCCTVRPKKIHVQDIPSR